MLKFRRCMTRKVVVNLLKFFHRFVLMLICRELNEITNKKLSIIKTDNCRTKVPVYVSQRVSRGSNER